MELKTIFRFFIIFFIIFGLVGYIKGRNDVSKFLPHYLFDRVIIGKINNVHHLAYIKDRDTLYTYNVDNNTVGKIDREALLKLSAKSNYDTNVFEYFKDRYLKEEYVIGTGVIATGITAQTFFQISNNGKIAVKPQTKEKTIGIVLGVISGYYIGYTIATKWNIPDEKSKEALDILSSKKSWIMAENIVYHKIYSDVKLKSQNIKEESLKNVIQQKLNRELQSAYINEDNAIDFKSENFTHIFRLRDIVLNASTN